MTQSEWLESRNPRTMLLFLQQSKVGSDRQLRLFAAAVCRRVWHLFPDDRGRAAVEVLEQYADGETTLKKLTAAKSALKRIPFGMARRTAPDAAVAAARQAAG